MSTPTAAAVPRHADHTARVERTAPPRKGSGYKQALALRGAVYAAAFFTFFVLLFLIGYILIRGIPYLTPSLFEMKYTSDNCSMMPAILMTVRMTLLSLLIAIPISVFTAVYLVEYAKRGNRLVDLIRLTTETLSGIPSIVYGLFGLLFFVTQLHWGMSLLAGSMTLAIMILPLIMRSTEEALLAVPDMYREASFGLGAGKLRTTFRVVLPNAMPGILAGIILAVGRVVGETAALMYTAGTSTDTASGLMDSGRTLAVHMYCLSSEGLHTNQAYATAVVLLLIVLLMNTLSALIARKLTKS
ncbi:MAG: phosphate ABC transporter permease PstA [Butyricicoccus sp.]